MLLVERCEELVLEAFDDRAERRELLTSVFGEADRLSPSVVRIAAPLDQPVLLECVEEADELAAVELERVGDRRLRVSGSYVEQREDAVVVRSEPCRLELRQGAGLDCEAQPGEQEDRAGEQLSGEALRCGLVGRLQLCGYVHRNNCSWPNRLWYLSWKP